MKKLVFMFVAIAAISFASCGNKTAQNTASADSDTAQVDTTVADTAAADTAAVRAGICSHRRTCRRRAGGCSDRFGQFRGGRRGRGRQRPRGSAALIPGAVFRGGQGRAAHRPQHEPCRL